MLIPLGQLVRDKLNEEGRSTLHKFESNLAVAARAARRLRVDVNAPVKTVFLTPTSYNTIIVPDDFYDYSKIGVCAGGQVYNLSVNPNLCFPHMKNDCGQLQPEQFASGGYTGGLDEYFPYAIDSGFGYWYYNFWNENGEFTGKLYGHGQGWSPFGQYCYNPDNKEFVVTPNLAGETICLEYATLDMNNAQILVPEEADEYIITFMNWKTAKGGERAQHEAEHHLAESRLRISIYGFSEEEMTQTVRHSYMLSPKG